MISIKPSSLRRDLRSWKAKGRIKNNGHLSPALNGVGGIDRWRQLLQVPRWLFGHWLPPKNPKTLSDEYRLIA
jgi:hypothetical protein